MEFIYRFEPKRSKTYLLELAIYGGYNVGDRNSHMHLPRIPASTKLWKCST